MRILPFLLTGLTSFITFYLGTPTISFGFSGILFFILINTAVFVVTNIIADDFEFPNLSKLKYKVPLTLFIACLFMLFIVPIFNTWGLFNASKYRSLIGNVETKQTNTIMSPIDPQNIVIIDEETAHRLADKVLGSGDITLGSESVIGDLVLQKVGDKLFYVAPLLHSGFFKWWSNGDRGTKGYVMVNANNDKDVRLIQSVDKKPISIVYQPNAFFSTNLERYIYMNGYMTQGFTDYSFEIDDNMKPYYVVSLYEKKVGYSGRSTTGTLLVDVETGEIKRYSIKNTPKWVDRIHPQEFIEEQLSDWGEYVHGWFNPSNKDRVSPTPHISLVYGENGECYFYTGITSYGKNDQSSIGFVLINSRTKKAFFYKQSGATETAAQASAEGRVQEKGYSATSPRPYNVDGVWTYVMALKDTEGLIKMVALVSVSNYEIVGVGNDIKSAIRDYKSALNSTGNVIATSNKGEGFSVSEIVSRVSTDVRNGNTYYYLLLKNNEDKVFVSSSATSEELPLTLVGDSVIVQFDDSGNSYIDIKFFDNLIINPQKTQAQKNVEKYSKAVKDKIELEENNKNADATWEELTPKQKQELLKKK